MSEYVDATGTSVAHYEYDTFGGAIASGTKANDFSHQFSTKQLDAETDLHYYGYRYYDSSNGRWLGRDPIEEGGGLNIYAFVANKSINNSDELGLKMSTYKIGSAKATPSTGAGLSSNEDGRTSAYWSKGNKFTGPTKNGNCWKLKVSGKLKIDIVYRKGSTLTDKFGNSPLQHEREHEEINGFFYNLAKDNINPLEGYYCRKECADLAKSWGEWEYSYYNGRAIARNARGDLRAYGHRLTREQTNEFLAKVASGDQQAYTAYANTEALKIKLNNKKCRVYKKCPL